MTIYSLLRYKLIPSPFQYRIRASRSQLHKKPVFPKQAFQNKPKHSFRCQFVYSSNMSFSIKSRPTRKRRLVSFLKRKKKVKRKSKKKTDTYLNQLQFQTKPTHPSSIKFARSNTKPPFTKSRLILYKRPHARLHWKPLHKKTKKHTNFDSHQWQYHDESSLLTVSATTKTSPGTANEKSENILVTAILTILFYSLLNPVFSKTKPTEGKNQLEPRKKRQHKE